MRVDQLGRAYVVCADQPPETRKNQLQLFRLRRERLKQPTLKRSRLRRFASDRRRHDRATRRMRLNVQQQQLQKNFAVTHRERQSNYSLVFGTIFKLEPQSQLARG